MKNKDNMREAIKARILTRVKHDLLITTISMMASEIAVCRYGEPTVEQISEVIEEYSNKAVEYTNSNVDLREI